MNPAEIRVGQVWRNRQSRKAWTVQRLVVPRRREQPVVGPLLVVLGAADTTNQPSARAAWLRERYSFVGFSAAHFSAAGVATS